MERLIPGEATKKLSAIIPRENLAAYLKYFHAINDLSKDLELFPELPTEDLFTILTILDKWLKEGWINEESRLSIVQAVHAAMFNEQYDQANMSDPWNLAVEKFLLTNRTKQPDDSFNFLLCAIVFDYLFFKGSQEADWRLIVKFFSEQGVIEEDPEKVSLNKFKLRYRKNISTIRNRASRYLTILDHQGLLKYAHEHKGGFIDEVLNSPDEDENNTRNLLKK